MNSKLALPLMGFLGMLLPFQAQEAPRKVKLALAGDSTVAAYAPEKPMRGWGQCIGAHFKDLVEVENFAVGGKSSKSFIGEGNWERLLASKPDFILLQFGHNDSHDKSQPKATDAKGDYKDYLRKYADDAKKAGVEIVFVTPMHRRTFKNKEPSRELEPYADAMIEVAQEKGVQFVDLHRFSGSLLKETGEDGAVPLFCSPGDRSHFSQQGAEKMAALIAEGLKRTDSPLKKFLKDE